ncbi:MAG: choice-of-anchor D domain-containing protein [Planctomycetota bacterium]
MKYRNSTNNQRSIVVFVAAVLLCGNLLLAYEDIEFSGGVTAEIDYTVDGSVWIYDAKVTLVEPAHILGFVLTDCEAVLDIYGGKIDYLLMITGTDLSLPEGIVTVYGTDFAVDGVPVDPDTGELFLMGQTLSGVYENGTPFAFPIDCVLIGSSNFIYYQTVKLGWVTPEPDIELSESNYHFGQTDIETSQSGVVSVLNLGTAPLTIESLQLEQSQQAQFAFTPWQTLPAIVEPNSFIDLEIQFGPVAEGIDTAVLSISSNDPNDPVVDVVLTGEGVSAELSNEELIMNVLDVYESALEDGSIQGVGNGNSADNKTETFGKMLLIVDELIAAGLYDSAMEALRVIEAKCDGQKSPKDFIQGEAAVELNAMVNELIESLSQ